MPADPWTIVLAAGAGRRLASLTGGVPETGPASGRRALPARAHARPAGIARGSRADCDDRRRRAPPLPAGRRGQSADRRHHPSARRIAGPPSACSCRWPRSRPRPRTPSSSSPRRITASKTTTDSAAASGGDWRASRPACRTSSCSASSPPWSPRTSGGLRRRGPDWRLGASNPWRRSSRSRRFTRRSACFPPAPSGTR